MGSSNSKAPTSVCQDSGLRNLEDLPVKGCVVLCSRLQDTNRVNTSALTQGMVWLVTAGQLNIRNWISHFALRIWTYCEDDDTWRSWRLERCTYGVLLFRVNNGDKDPGETDARWYTEGDFNGKIVTMKDVHEFVQRQRRYGYDVLGRNCKNFAYDFFHEVLGDDVRFETFCHSIERSLDKGSVPPVLAGHVISAVA